MLAAGALIGACALVVCVALAEAEPPPAPEPSARAFRSWTTESGLPQNSVHAIAQTPDGYLWIGTQEGLARFDGARFVVFDRHRMAGGTSNAIQALHVARDGSLWIGTTRGGLSRFKDGVFEPPCL